MPSDASPNADVEKATAAPDAESVKALDWDGLDDPANPLNWSSGKKTYHTVIISALAMATTFGVSVYSVAIDSVSHHFHVGHVAAIVPLTLFVLGQGLGPMMAAPLSETYGRKAVFNISAPIGLVFTLGAGFSSNFGTLCVLRFLAGAFGSPSLSVGNGTITDMVPPIDRSLANAAFNLAPFLGTALGPMVGGFAVMKKGWRWSQWLIIFVSFPAWLGSLFMSETYKKIILQRRAKQRGLPIPPTAIPHGAVPKARFFLTATLFRPIAMLFREPIVGCFSLYVAFNFSVLFSFFDAFPVVFAGVYGFNLGETGLSFTSIAVGVVVEFFMYFLIDRLTYRKMLFAKRAKGDDTPLAPEHRLYAAMLGSCLIPLGLFWFGWTSKTSVHWICPAIASAVFGCGNLLVFASCMLYLIDTYGGVLAASATGANGLLRYALGGASPLYTEQMYHALGIGWATSLLAFIAVAMLPIPWVLFKYGPAIRARSTYKPAV